MADVKPAPGNGGTGKNAAPGRPIILDSVKTEIAAKVEKSSVAAEPHKQFLAQFAKDRKDWPPEIQKLLNYIDLQDDALKQLVDDSSLLTQNEKLAQARQEAEKENLARRKKWQWLDRI